MLKRAITENTTISIGLMVLIIGVVMWLTTLNVTASGTEKKVIDLQARFEKHEEAHSEELKGLDERLSRMEGYLQQIVKHNH